MKIELITPEEYQKMKSIYLEHPELTLQNKGYETINKNTLNNKAKDALKEVEEILKRSICGFSSFQNFKLNKAGELTLRLQYNYNYDGDGLTFIGVGYIELNELLNGFNN